MGGIGVLITRTQPGAERTAATLRGLGYTALISPALTVCPSQNPTPALHDIQAIICTSAHGVVAIANASGARDLPLFCLAGGSVDMARERGVGGPLHADAITARVLSETIIETLAPDKGPVLWVRGRHFAFDMKAALTSQGFTVREWQGYEARPASALTKEASQAIRQGAIKAALFHSARGAKTFLALAQQSVLSLEKITAIAMSAEVAAGLENQGFFQVNRAIVPGEAAMIGALQSHLPLP
ncbi:MAG: uroporphyrinogen-III synthase [Robiginitomaculum sp.]|nr:uroporphyrinogen-III synthase [Robiginitomaculum sp.]MDQ7077759.1 uroporphyrinogen-III synthase [Robiginitomaculum sp.]